MADDDFSRQLQALERLAAPPRPIKKKRSSGRPEGPSPLRVVKKVKELTAEREKTTMPNETVTVVNNEKEKSIFIPARSYVQAESDLESPTMELTGDDFKNFTKSEKRVRKLSVSLGSVELPQPASKRPKGFKSILKNRRILSLDNMGDQFQMPEPLILNDYWAFFPVPQKALFRDLLTLSPAEPVTVPPKPEITNAQLWRLQDFEAQFSAVQKERAQLLGLISTLEKDPSSATINPDGMTVAEKVADLKAQCAELANRLEMMEAENQEHALEHARAVYDWNLQRDTLEAESKAQLKLENDRKVTVLNHLGHGLKAQLKHMNTVQNAVLDIEMPKTIESVGGINGEIPEITAETPIEQAQKIDELKTRVRDVLDKVKGSSVIKAKISVNQGLIKNLMDPLKAHMPQTKGKYEKTGEFTKEKRAAKVATARPYNKTGKHIHDYQNPRDKKQRDKQIEDRAKKLGVSVEEFRQCVMGK